MFFSKIFAFLFSVFWKYKLYNFVFVWRRDLNTGLFDIWQVSCITYFWKIWWNEMWWDDQLSSSLWPPGWHSHRTHRTGRKTKLWTQKKWTDAGWLDWKGMLKKICRNLATVMSNKRSGRWYCRCCCCIREVEEECKRRSWPSSAVEEEEEVWAPHDDDLTDEGENMVEIFDSW